MPSQQNSGFVPPQQRRHQIRPAKDVMDAICILIGYAESASAQTLVRALAYWHNCVHGPLARCLLVVRGDTIKTIKEAIALCKALRGNDAAVAYLQAVLEELLVRAEMSLTTSSWPRVYLDQRFRQLFRPMLPLAAAADRQDSPSTAVAMDSESSNSLQAATMAKNQSRRAGNGGNNNSQAIAPTFTVPGNPATATTTRSAPLPGADHPHPVDPNLFPSGFTPHPNTTVTNNPPAAPRQSTNPHAPGFYTTERVPGINCAYPAHNGMAGSRQLHNSTVATYNKGFNSAAVTHLPCEDGVHPFARGPYRQDFTVLGWEREMAVMRAELDEIEAEGWDEDDKKQWGLQEEQRVEDEGRRGKG
ncbi:hypothetical protein GE09DRAFT_1220675 [Coniochaeta sp. 2T2.1]|nr:hypothetical protein GE09DRAFT_1220675 [Coniochaeta sp. 2T2.1]